MASSAPAEVRAGRGRSALAIVLVVVGGTALALLAAAPASAFVCTRVTDANQQETGPSLWWNKRSITYTLFQGGTEDIAGDLEDTVIRESFEEWETVRDCRTPQRMNDIVFLESATRSTTDRIGYDFVSPGKNENLMIFRDRGWQLLGQDKVIALTTTTYKPLTGEIVDADIEFNSANFPFVTDATNATSSMDLGNAATHEIGHLLGLGHSDVPESTMEPTGNYGEVKKRTLECDDRNGIVFKYPAGGETGYCDPAIATCGYCAKPDRLTSTPQVEIADGGCSATPPAGAVRGLTLPVLVALLGLARRRHT